MLQTTDTASEVSLTDSVTSFDNNGISLGTDATYQRVNKNLDNYINHFFKRAPGVFDMVCYTGTNPYGGQVNNHRHSLGVMPELVIIKSRATATNNNWLIIDYINRAEYTNQMGWLPSGFLNSAAAFTNSLGAFVSFTSIGFTGASANMTGTNTAWYDEAGKTYVMYLFATFPGISKVGRYTGNGSSQTVNCGFTTGARFILIKRTDNTGDWYVWDTVRGIVAANDPHLSLNTSAAEVITDDSVDPHASGFIVNQVAATNINVSGGQYIFLSVA